MRTGLVISGTGHAVILLWSVLTLAGTRLPHPAATLPVDVISTSDFSQLTRGAKTAPQVEQPKPVAEQIGPLALVENPAAPVAQKEVKASTDVPPAPTPKPPAPKPKRAAAAPADPIAEAIKKSEVKPPDPKPAPKAPPTPVRKPAPSEPPFDPRSIAQLLNKQQAQRVAAAGPEINNRVTRGTQDGTAAQLSLSETDALRARLQQLWNPPPGARDAKDLIVVVHVKFKPDGSVDGRPEITNSGSGPLFTAASRAAVRALLAGQPFTMLKPEHYELWQDIEITFDNDMIAGG